MIFGVADKKNSSEEVAKIGRLNTSSLIRALNILSGDGLLPAQTSFQPQILSTHHYRGVNTSHLDGFATDYKMFLIDI